MDLEPPTRITPELDLPSRASQRVLRELRRLAQHVAISVCLVGPSGTGKSLYAREIHRLSPRRHGPYVYLNLAAVPKGLVSAEIRGHQRGAFTGAIDRRDGRVLRASGGTLVLDEIAKSSRHAQHELLQLFDRAPITSLGGDQEMAFDARLVALSSLPLAQAVSAGSLIPDLYERLKPFVLEIAPLSQRPEDVPVVFEAAIRRHAASFGYSAPPHLDASLLSYLQLQEFSGNHREVDGIAQRVLASAAGVPVLRIRHLPQLRTPSAPSVRSKRERYETDRESGAVRRFATIREEAGFYGVSEATMHRWKRERRTGEGKREANLADLSHDSHDD
ncbi:MAG: sigma 54-interacting transcriptional regulator [Gemmatimonadales bacterium]|nr:sigma 54-interacting transcriptional regulator [Gemmatimonadales bacterium]